MAPNPRRQDEKLDALYAQIPALVCRGLCHDSCGPIEMSVRERERIEREAGKPLTCGMLATCSMLTEDRRCGVYEIRPMICRIWGTTRKMRCHYGCRPERWLSAEETARLIAEADLIGGDPGGRERRLREVLDDHMAFLRAAETVEKHAVTPTLEGRARALPRTIIDR